MTDREKVIKGLNCCTHTDGAECPNCPYWQDDDCVEALNADALALMKEQEKIGHWIYKKYDDMFMCSCCEKYSIRNDYPYCHWCGAKMESR